MERGMMCAVYARVSDESQVKGESIEHQINFAKTYARRRATEAQQVWDTPDTLTYVDEGITGTSMVKRPAVKRLIADARIGRFQVVIFKGISRFARDTVDALVMLRTLLACGIRVLSIEENFDSQRDSAEFVFTIHSALAQAESEKTAVRVRLGAMEKARGGRWNGRVPDGYRLNPHTKLLEVDESFAPVIRDIFDLYLNGYGCRRIAQFLNHRQMFTRQGNMWNQRNISRLLRNPAYVGDVVYGRRTKRLALPDEGQHGTRKVTVQVEEPEDIVIKQNAHQPIIDREAFEKVARMLNGRQQTRRGQQGEAHHLLSGGLLRCRCGSSMTAKQNGRGTVYYRCAGQMDKGKAYCAERYVRAQWIEQALLERVREDMERFLKFQHVQFTPCDREEEHFSRISHERKQQQRRTQLLFDKFSDGTLSQEQFDHMNTLVRQRLTFLDEMEERLLAQTTRASSPEDTQRSVKQHVDWIFQQPYAKPAWTRELLRALVDEVYLVCVHRDAIELGIRYRFSP